MKVYFAFIPDFTVFFNMFVEESKRIMKKVKGSDLHSTLNIECRRGHIAVPLSCNIPLLLKSS